MSAAGASNKKCEGCEKKDPPVTRTATFGLSKDRVRRWCGGCAGDHEGAIDIVSKKCEDCKEKLPTFGRVEDGKRRWCGKCAKNYVGAVDVAHKKCETCKGKVRGRRPARPAQHAPHTHAPYTPTHCQTHGRHWGPAQPSLG
jgi:hypothetical protein